MRYRSAVVLGAAALAVCAGSEPPAPAPPPSRTPSVAYAFLPADSFDNLGPTETSAELPEAAPTRATVTVATRPIARPPKKAPARASMPEPTSTAGVLASAYRAAVESAPASCRMPVSLLAAIGQVESGSVGGRSITADHRVVPAIYGPLLDGGAFASIPDTDGGRIDGDGQWDRAVGPMQFIPGTWRWAGVDGDKDGRADPQNVFDAAASAAGYLCRGRDLSHPGHVRAAILSYNQSADYLSAVLEWKSYFEANGLAAIGEVAFRVGSGGRASDLAPAEPTESPTTATSTAAPTRATTGRAGARGKARVPEPASTTPPRTTTPTSTATTTATTPPGTTTTTTPSATTTTPPSTTTPAPTTTTPAPPTTTTSPPPAPS